MPRPFNGQIAIDVTPTIYDLLDIEMPSKDKGADRCCCTA